MTNSNSRTMASLEEPLLRVVVPLDVGLIVHSEVLGRSFPINSSVGIARIIMPTTDDTAQISGGYPPIVAPPGFERVRADILPGAGWAMWTSRKKSPPVGQVIVEALAFELSLPGMGITEAQLSEGYIKGVNPIVDELKGWVNPPATLRDGFGAMAVDVMRPPPDDPKLCGQQKIVRWPLASA